MKIKRINTAFLLLALAGMTLTGCSNEDIANVTPQEGTGNVSFSIVEKDYEPADNTPKSRTAIEETKPEIQDLGNGLIAEVSLVPDTTHRADVPKTRAINTPTHYTIQAYQGGVKKGELKGTFNGSMFTPDAGQPEAIGLPHGTYDFVCFNDGVTANGTQLTVNRANAGTARFDVRRNVQINQDPKQQVKFTMKHAGAAITFYTIYVNTALRCKTTSSQYVDDKGQLLYKLELIDPAEKFTYTEESLPSAVPEIMTYNLSTHTYDYPTMGQISKPGTVNLGGIPVTMISPGAHLYLGDQPLLKDYWLPTTDCSKIKLIFTSGEIAGVSLAGKSITVPEQKLVEANKEYLIYMRFYITDLYIYSDGTEGPLSKNPGKHPVAVLVNSTSGQHVAFALQDVKVGGSDQVQWNSSTSQESSNPVTNYSQLFSNPLMGYGEIPSSSLGTAMQAAKNYIPLHPLPAGHDWQLPNFYNCLLGMGVCLGKMMEADGAHRTYFFNGRSFSFLIPPSAAATGFTPVPSSVNFPAMDMTRFNDAFTKVGGTPPSGTYWTSTECKDGTEYKMATITISSDDGKLHLGLKSKTETAKVRPVIYH